MLQHTAKLLRLPAVLAALVLAACGPAVYRVDSARDSDAPGDARPGDGVCATAVGDCTLRAAVEEATHSRTAARIELPAGMTVALRNPLPLTGRLEIAGPVPQLGTNPARIVSARALHGAILPVRPGTQLTLSGLVLRGEGKKDGSLAAVAPGGTLHIRDSWLVGSRGGAAIYNQGRLSIDNAVFADNESNRFGAAILTADGRTAVRDAVFVGNRARGGGAVAWYGRAAAVTIERSVFAGNQGRKGGAIFAKADAGVYESVIVNNAASDDTGGLRGNRRGDIVLRNTVIAGNRDKLGLLPDCALGRPAVSLGGNVQGVADAAAAQRRDCLSDGKGAHVGAPGAAVGAQWLDAGVLRAMPHHATAPAAATVAALPGVVVQVLSDVPITGAVALHATTLGVTAPSVVTLALRFAAGADDLVWCRNLPPLAAADAGDVCTPLRPDADGVWRLPLPAAAPELGAAVLRGYWVRAGAWVPNPRRSGAVLSLLLMGGAAVGLAAALAPRRGRAWAAGLGLAFVCAAALAWRLHPAQVLLPQAAPAPDAAQVAVETALAQYWQVVTSTARTVPAP